MAVNYIEPKIGQTYTLRSGGEYRCLFVSNPERVERGECSAVMVRLKDGWELIAHGIQQNEDGTIEWKYSTGGHWPKEEKNVRFEIWKNCEMGQACKITEFDSRLAAAEWIFENERNYPGWYLRIVESRA